MVADAGAGDTKAGTLVGTDKFGNKYYENWTDELPCMAPIMHPTRCSNQAADHNVQQYGRDGWTTRSTTLTRTSREKPPPYEWTGASGAWLTALVRPQGPDRAFLACMDFLRRRQAPNGGSHCQSSPQLGEALPYSQLHSHERRLQALQHVCLESRREEAMNGTNIMTGPSPRSILGSPRLSQDEDVRTGSDQPAVNRTIENVWEIICSF
jgi:hypothetical protein